MKKSSLGRRSSAAATARKTSEFTDRYLKKNQFFKHKKYLIVFQCHLKITNFITRIYYKDNQY